MRLTDLEAFFVRYESRDGVEHHIHVDGFTEADGVTFVCPLCNGHSVCVWFAGRPLPAAVTPTPRWSASGTSLDDLTLSPSIHIQSCWHGFVVGGEVTTV